MGDKIFVRVGGGLSDYKIHDRSSRENNDNCEKTVTIFVSSGLNYFNWSSQPSTTLNKQENFTPSQLP